MFENLSQDEKDAFFDPKGVRKPPPRINEGSDTTSEFVINVERDSGAVETDSIHQYLNDGSQELDGEAVGSFYMGTLLPFNPFYSIQRMWRWLLHG